MKKVISGNELYEKMEEAINLLCGTVKTTLGPVGNNVIIDHSSFTPFITNDGVTIAENISSEDEVINTILELAKEASIKTNENVGDGTTTTLVLLESIFKQELDLIKNSKKPIILKQELEIELNKIIEEISIRKRKTNKSDLINIAINSSNDYEIGKLMSEVYSKIKNKNGITIKEYDNPYTKVEYLKGYSFESILSSPYFLKNNIEIVYYNAKILLVNNIIEDINSFGEILNEAINNNINLVIIAKDYDDYVANQLVSLNIDNNVNIILLKLSDYGLRMVNILNDVSLISNAKIIDNNIYNIESLGNVDKIIINNEITRLEFKNNKNINKYVNDLKKELKNIKNSFDYEFINKRIAMFKYGCANIYVGGITKTERIEKKMRFDDALCALSVTNDGSVPGSGIVLLEISDKLNNDTDIEKLFKEALKKPFEQILINAGIDYLEIVNEIRINNYEVLFNVKTNSFENINDTKVIDPYNVLVDSLKNAVSIASMLITTNSLIINEQINNLNKINDYNEI